MSHPLYHLMSILYLRGNNVVAYKALDLLTTKQSSAPLNFDYTFDASKQPVLNVNPAVVNGFYIGNMVHDLTYRYGAFMSLNGVGEVARLILNIIFSRVHRRYGNV